MFFVGSRLETPNTAPTAAKIIERKVERVSERNGRPRVRCVRERAGKTNTAGATISARARLFSEKTNRDPPPSRIILLLRPACVRVRLGGDGISLKRKKKIIIIKGIKRKKKRTSSATTSRWNASGWWAAPHRPPPPSPTTTTAVRNARNAACTQKLNRVSSVCVCSIISFISIIIFFFQFRNFFFFFLESLVLSLFR